MAKGHILVSGGSGGIGAATCECLLNKDFIPIVSFNGNQEKAEEIAARTGGFSLRLDLTSEASVDDAVATLVARNIMLEGIVLAASPLPTLGPFGQATTEDILHQLQVHALGPHRLLTAVLRHWFRKQKRGAVVGILSEAVGTFEHVPASRMGAYVVGKFGLAGVLAVFASEHPWLRVSTLKLGFTETPMLQVFDDRYLELQRDRAPFSSPEQVAATIVGRICADD